MRRGLRAGAGGACRARLGGLPVLCRAAGAALAGVFPLPPQRLRRGSRASGPPSPALRASVCAGAQAPYSPRSARVAHRLRGLCGGCHGDVHAHCGCGRVLARLGLVHVRGRCACRHSMSLPSASLPRWFGRRTSSQNGLKT